MRSGKGLLLSMATGCLLSIPWIFPAFPWVLWIAFVPLLMVEDHYGNNHTGSPFFGYAFIAFFLWNLLSTWWIAFVSLPGMLIISLINAMLMASVWWLAFFICRKFRSPSGHFVLIVFWLTFEYLHFHWSMQWPWMTLGNGFAHAVKWIQWYEFTGAMGGSLWILMVNTGVYYLIKKDKLQPPSSILKTSLACLLLLLLPAGWSWYRYSTYKVNDKTIPVTLLQPNIDPYKEKFSAMSTDEQTQKLIALADSLMPDSTRYVLAPETALETMWESDTIQQVHSLQPINHFLQKHPNTTLVAGAITQRELRLGEPSSHTSRKLPNGRFYEVFNSALLINHTSTVQIGHKSRLVSGVEKMPFQEYFSFLSNYVINAGGMSGSLTASAEPTVFKTDEGINIGSVICFESAFGDFVASTVKKGANILFIITNDGWWKSSAGVTQHFDYARLRAIETRRSVARSANTGISGFIDPKGDVISKTPINKATALSALLPLNDTITFYVRMGDYIGQLSAVLALMVILFGIGRKKIRNIYN